MVSVRRPRAALPTLALALALALAVAAPRMTVAAPDAGSFVAQLGNRALELLADKTASDEQQERNFRELLRDGFAVRSIGLFVLGKYRRTAPRQQVEEFLALFEDYVISLYASQFRNYSGETFDVKRVVKTTSEKDVIVAVQVNPTGGREPIRVDFQVRDVGGGTFKIVDVKIEGVSMIIAQRDEFTTFIGKNGGDVGALNDTLRKKTQNLKTRATAAK